MTRRDWLYKWFVYGLGLLPLWLLDAYLLPRYPIWGITPMLLIPILVSVAVMEGAYAGAGFGMVVGLLWEAAYAGGFGSMILFMTLLGTACGALSQYALSQSIAGCMLCTTGALLVLDGARVARGLITNAASLGPLLRVAVPECLLTLLWTPLIYLIFRQIFRRVGGTKLA